MSDPSDPAPGAAQSPAPAGSPGPLFRGMRTHRIGLLRAGDDAAALAPQGDAP